MEHLLLAEDVLFGANDRGIIVFGFEIYYYAICIVSGILLATCLSALLMKRRNMSTDFIFTLFIFCIPSALICARLYYCITDGMSITQWFSWDSIRTGGLSVIGGVIGGVTAGLIVCLVKKVDFFRAADCVVVTILVAQAMGRWGNFFNKEVYGGVVANSSMEWFPFAVPVSPSNSVHGIGSFSDPRATWHYAFFFYEMLLNLVGFGLLFTGAWFWKKKPNGVLMCSYFVWYGLVRSIMEPLRDPAYILDGGGVPWSLVTSILMVIGGLTGIAVLLLINYKKEGALIGSKTGDPCGITEYMTPYKDDTPYYSKINMMGKNYPVKPKEGTEPTPLPPSDGGGIEASSDREGTEPVSDEKGTKVVSDGEGTKVVSDGESTKVVSDGEGTKVVSDGEGTKVVSDGEGTKVVSDEKKNSTEEEGTKSEEKKS